MFFLMIWCELRVECVERKLYSVVFSPASGTIDPKITSFLHNFVTHFQVTDIIC